MQNVALPSFLLMCPTVALLTQFPFRFSNLDFIIHPTQGVSKEIKSYEGFDPVYDLCSVAQRDLKKVEQAAKNDIVFEDNFHTVTCLIHFPIRFQIEFGLHYSSGPVSTKTLRWDC